MRTQYWQPSAGAFPVPKVCQNAMFFVPLGLALSERQIPNLLKLQRRRSTDGAVGVGQCAPKAGGLRLCLVRDLDEAAVLLNSKWKGRTNQFGWLQACATRNSQ